MTSRQNRKQRREAERNARKLADKEAQTNPTLSLDPSTSEPLVPQPHPSTLAYMAELRAQADRALEAEFGAEFIAYSREVSDRIARRVGLDVPSYSRPETNRHAVNRQNAQLSTGPRTPEGKLASSRNSLKHGLASGALVILGEDPSAFETLRNTLLREHQPADTTEEMLVQELAQSYWLLQRAIRFQNDCFTAEGPDGNVDEKRLALFLRYGTTHERAFHKALNTLFRLQKERRKAQPAPENGFVSQTEAHSSSAPPPFGFVSQKQSFPVSSPFPLSEVNGHSAAENEEKIPDAA